MINKYFILFFVIFFALFVFALFHKNTWYGYFLIYLFCGAGVANCAYLASGWLDYYLSMHKFKKEAPIISEKMNKTVLKEFERNFFRLNNKGRDYEDE